MALALLRKQRRSTGLNTAWFRSMVDNMPVAVMVCDPETFEITYINATSKSWLKSIEHILPVPADRIVGSCIDIFHKNPSHQRRLLSDPRNLPHQAVISVGDQKLKLDDSALMDKSGEYLGPMVAWSVVTEQVKMADGVAEVVNLVSSASTELNANATSLTQNADVTRDRASTVAAAANELGSSINEISRQVSHTTEVAREADEAAKTSSEMIDGPGGDGRKDRLRRHHHSGYCRAGQPAGAQRDDRCGARR